MGSSDSVLKVGSASDVTNVNNLTKSMFSNLQSDYGTGSAFEKLMSESPRLMDLVFGATSPLAEAYGAQGDILSTKAVQDVANQFSGMGALNSGAALSAMTRGAADVRANLMSQLASQQTSLLGNLLGTTAQGEYGLENTALGIMGSYAQPEWWQPTYIQQEGQGIGDILGSALGIAGGLGLTKLAGELFK